jgi:hypothetical protein
VTVNEAQTRALHIDPQLRAADWKLDDRTQVRLEVRSIRDKPLRSAAIAAGAGFVIGGGMATRPALALLALFGRKAAKETATNLMAGMVRARMH